MIKKKLFLVLPAMAILISVSTIYDAYAYWPFPDEPTVISESPTFVKKQVDQNTESLEIMPERLAVGNDFVKYRYQDESEHFTFESAGVSFTFDKTDCRIRLFERGFVQTGETPLIPSIITIDKEAVNGTDIWSPTSLNNLACNFSYQTNPDGVTITARQSDYDLFGNGSEMTNIYEADYKGSLKQVYQHRNNDPAKTNSKYGFTQLLQGTFQIQIGDRTYTTASDDMYFSKEQLEGKTIRITGNGAAIYYDTENENHNYLWAVKIKSQQLVLDYLYSKGPLNVGDTLTIDPTYTLTATGDAIGMDGGSVSSRIGQRFDAGHLLIGKHLNSFSFWIFKAGSPTGIGRGSVYSSTGSLIENSTNTTTWGTLTTSPVKYTFNFNGTHVITAGDYFVIQGGSHAGANEVDIETNSADSVANTITTFYNGAWGTSARDSHIEVVYDKSQVRYENRPYMSDGSTVIGSGSMIRTNATSSSTKNLNGTGYATWTDTVDGTPYNYTTKDALDNFVDNKTNNKILVAPQSQTGTTQIYQVDCSPGVDNDHQVKMNFTNYHLLTLTTPNCNSDGDISFTGQFLKQGLGPATNQTTKLIDRVIDTSEYTWLPGKLTVNGTTKIGTYLSGLANFTGIQVGNGYNTIALRFVIFTDNVTSAPQDLRVNSISSNSIKLFWQAPASNHGAYPYSYAVYRDGSLLRNSTGNVLTYTDNTLSAGTTHSYAVCAWNRIGCSPTTSLGSNTTYTGTLGTISIVKGNVGDAVNVNATITVTAGSPAPFTVSDVFLYDNNTLVKTNSTDFAISAVGQHYVSRIWYQITNSGLNIFHVEANISNSTGTAHLSSANANVTREYDPAYYAAIDTAEGSVNATTHRSDGENTVNIKINRNKGGNIFNVECLVQTNFQAQFGNGTGTWINRTNVGYYNVTITGMRNTHLYGTCYNSGELLTFTSYTNSSLALFGIAAFDNSYGSFIGVPVGVLFIAMAAAMASQRTAPTWIVVILGMIGIMTTVGFFTVDSNVWALAIVAGMLGLFVGRKFF